MLSQKNINNFREPKAELAGIAGKSQKVTHGQMSLLTEFNSVERIFKTWMPSSLHAQRLFSPSMSP
jgi:hypothetical protein